MHEIDRLHAESDRQAATAIAERQKQELRNAELTGRNAATESSLVQRQEELAQLWKQLLTAEKALGTAEAVAAQERDQRETAELRAGKTESDIIALHAQFEDARKVQATASDNVVAEVVMLTRFLRDQNAASMAAQTARDAAEKRLARRDSENAELVQKMQQQALEASAAQAARNAAETRLARQQRESDQLSSNSRQQGLAIEASETARVAAERRLANRFDEIARLTTMLSEAAGRSGTSEINANWFRDVMQVSQTFPNWWAIMPEKWQRKREHARYLSTKLFDAQQYLENNPDVAGFDIDPVLHYILHGMNEGRKWTR